MRLAREFTPMSPTFSQQKSLAAGTDRRVALYAHKPAVLKNILVPYKGS